jgi:hypothetical protein
MLWMSDRAGRWLAADFRFHLVLCFVEFLVILSSINEIAALLRFLKKKNFIYLVVVFFRKPDFPLISTIKNRQKLRFQIMDHHLEDHCILRLSSVLVCLQLLSP